MSIEKDSRGNWRCRWREGNHNRSKTIGPRKADAIAFEQELKRAKRLGTLAHMEMGTDYFEQFVENDYWPKHALKLSVKWQRNQAYVLDKYLIPRFGSYRLAEITLADVDDLFSDLRAKGTGTRAQQLVHQVLVTILNKAVRWQKMASNPAALADKPKHKRKPINPPTPLEVEHVREQLQGMDRPGDAVLVSVLAYAGLRPQEALALTWDDIRDSTILVGPEGKTGHRSVDLWKPLASDLAEWKLATGGRWHLVFPTDSGNPWTETNWSNWRDRIWHGKDWKGRAHDHPDYSGSGGVGIPGTTPYALRHTFCSLMLRSADMPIYEQAKQAGHSARVHEDEYGHLFSELKGKGSAEQAIASARLHVSKGLHLEEAG